MKILVTGGAGFIGSHIVDALVFEGHQVSVVDNLLTGKIENINSAAKFYEFDISDSALLKLMQKEHFEYVVHHAAQVNVRLSVNNPGADAQHNIIGTLNFMQGCQHYGIRGIIFASSGGAVYGEPGQLPAKEIHDKGPLSPYGVSKLSAEYYLYCFARIFGLPYVALRYGNVYGPRQDADGESGVVALFGKKLLLGQVPVIFGNGEQTRDYVYVEDVVQANLLALKLLEKHYVQDKTYPTLSGLDSWAFNIASQQATSVNELFQLLKNIAAYSGPAQYSNPRPGELQRIFLDVSKARKVLGWEATVGLHEGLGITLNYLRQSLKDYKINS